MSRDYNGAQFHRHNLFVFNDLFAQVHVLLYLTATHKRSLSASLTRLIASLRMTIGIAADKKADRDYAPLVMG